MRTPLTASSRVTIAWTLPLVLACGGDGNPTQPAPPGPPPAATQLAFTVQPTTTTAGTVIVPALQVAARDARGNVVTGFTGNVTVTLGTNPSGGTLSGTTTVAAVAGVASFGNLSIDRAGAGYTIRATASGLTAATSAAFDITAAAAVTRLYLSPLLDFKLRPNPTPISSGGVEVCLSTSEWSATLAGDMVGTSYSFSLGVKTASTSSGTGTLRAEIIHKRGPVETVLATTTFTTAATYEVKTAVLTGPDPDARAGDTLLLRVRIVVPSPGLPCVAEFAGPGTANFIEVPRTTVQTN